MHTERRVAKFAFSQTRIVQSIPDCVEVNIAIGSDPIYQ